MSTPKRPAKGRQRGEIEPLPSGSLRVKVYVGIDPISGRQHYINETIPAGPNAAKEAEKARTRIINKIDEQRNATTNATVNRLMDRYLELLDVDKKTRKSYEGYIRNHIRPILGKLQVGRLNGETLDSFYSVLRRCRAHCDGRPFIEKHKTTGAAIAQGNSATVAEAPPRCASIQRGSQKRINAQRAPSMPGCPTPPIKVDLSGAPVSTLEPAADNQYQKIAADLRGTITCGALKPGDLLPTVIELKARYGVSAGTANRAIAELKASGLVNASRGKRAVVLAPEEEPDTADVVSIKSKRKAKWPSFPAPFVARGTSFRGLGFALKRTRRSSVVHTLGVANKPKRHSERFFPPRLE